MEHVIAGKAVAFFEALQPEFKEYSRLVVENAKRLAEALARRGYRIVTGGTDNHLFLVDLRPKGLTGKEAEERLDAVGITVNKNAIPFDPKPPRVTSGIRIGTRGDAPRRRAHRPGPSGGPLGGPAGRGAQARPGPPHALKAPAGPP